MMREFIIQKIKELKRTGLFRELRQLGGNTINFSSNDYLGLSKHPLVKARALEAINGFGFGAGASRLISGNTKLHEQLERKIAEFKGRAAALVFSTGYMANLGVITSMVDENDAVIIDRLNHASIIDACKLSKAKLQVYAHKDLAALKKILEQSAKYKKRLVITDSVFSMDGDIATLPEIIKLAKEYNAITIIDEAHATGVLGARGKGIEEYFGIEGQIDIVMGTLSKALGSIGGFVAGSQELIDYLRNKARSFIYTTALPPAACAAALAALEVIEKEPGLIRNLRINSRFLREKISKINHADPKNGTETLVSGSDETPIIPIMIGDTEKTMKVSAQLLERGFFVSGIRPPTVPEGKSRLRITLSALHTKKEIECLASLLQELIPA
ncbi:MAG: 8-amino-7-oxononanoate synthase [bacterium]